MNDGAVLKRYEQANLMAIATHSGVVFQSLMDIPRLVAERKKLLTRIAKLAILVGESQEDQEANDGECGTGSSDSSGIPHENECDSG